MKMLDGVGTTTYLYSVCIGIFPIPSLYYSTSTYHQQVGIIIHKKLRVQTSLDAGDGGKEKPQKQT